jgi:hypothetical protein
LGIISTVALFAGGLETNNGKYITRYQTSYG